MAVCKPNCVTAFTLPNFGAINDCDIINLLTSGEIAKVIFIVCNYEFVDVDDDAEWTDLLADGKITIPFVGNGKIDAQSESGEIRVGCMSVPTITKKPFEYTSYITDTTSQTDYAKYNQILSQRLGLSVMFLTCDGLLLINPSWTTGETAGIRLSSVKVSQIFGGEADGKAHYTINGELNEGRSLKMVKLSTATLAVL